VNPIETTAVSLTAVATLPPEHVLTLIVITTLYLTNPPSPSAALSMRLHHSDHTARESEPWSRQLEI
jgi:hypothetical protein